MGDDAAKSGLHLGDTNVKSAATAWGARAPAMGECESPGPPTMINAVVAISDQRGGWHKVRFEKLRGINSGAGLAKTDAI